MAINRKTGMQVSVFTVNSDYIDDLTNATVSIEVSDEDAAGVKEGWEIAWATGRRWSVEADLFAGGATYAAVAAYMMSLAAGSCLATVSFVSGANTYAGSGLLSLASHETKRQGLQTQKLTIKGQGALTVTPP